MNNLFFRCNRQLHAIEIIIHRDLASQPRTAFALEAFRVLEQVEFIVRGILELAAPFIVDIDMTGLTGAHAAT